jgi:hypothetical protein
MHARPHTHTRTHSHPCSYWLRFAFISLFEVPIHAFRKQRWELLASCLVSVSAYFGAMRLLYAWAPQTTTGVIIVPALLTMTLLAFGNW